MNKGRPKTKEELCYRLVAPWLVIGLLMGGAIMCREGIIMGERYVIVVAVCFLLGIVLATYLGWRSMTRYADVIYQLYLKNLKGKEVSNGEIHR